MLPHGRVELRHQPGRARAKGMVPVVGAVAQLLGEAVERRVAGVGRRELSHKGKLADDLSHAKEAVAALDHRGVPHAQRHPVEQQHPLHAHDQATSGELERRLGGPEEAPRRVLLEQVAHRHGRAHAVGPRHKVVWQAGGPANVNLDETHRRRDRLQPAPLAAARRLAAPRVQAVAHEASSFLQVAEHVWHVDAHSLVRVPAGCNLDVAEARAERALVEEDHRGARLRVRATLVGSDQRPLLCRVRRVRHAPSLPAEVRAGHCSGERVEHGVGGTALWQLDKICRRRGVGERHRGGCRCR
mmetsp:Transcript_16193/g.54525  ORF Transcript_16193/g.54525 Transcript_16193/m.54525 type:complete len:300 (-) Transcript_16193:199-1098(-)